MQFWVSFFKPRFSKHRTGWNKQTLEPSLFFCNPWTHSIKSKMFEQLEVKWKLSIPVDSFHKSDGLSGAIRVTDLLGPCCGLACMVSCCLLTDNRGCCHQWSSFHVTSCNLSMFRNNWKSVTFQYIWLWLDRYFYVWSSLLLPSRICVGLYLWPPSNHAL